MMVASNPTLAQGSALPEARIGSLQRASRAAFLGALGCATLLVIVGVAAGWSHPERWLDPLPAAPAVSLLVIAIVLARLGEAQLMQLRRLALFSEVHHLIKPRDTLEQATQALAGFLCAYRSADSCSIVMHDPQSAGWRLYRAARGAAACGHSGPIDAQLARPLLAMPAEQAVLYADVPPLFESLMCRAYEVPSLEPRDPEPETCAALANLIDARSFVSIPLHVRGQTIGRIHLGSQRVRFTPRDVTFLVQLVGQAAVMIENLRLVERLALEVASEERKRISRDLHDGTIQPYIGLKLGLEALRRKLPDAGATAGEVDELIRMAGDGILQLRQYVGRLKNTRQGGEAATLLPAVRRQVQKFSEYYGIQTQVLAHSDVELSARLHDEVLYMVREALSNIRRHTSAQRATISVHASDRRLVLEVVNERAEPPEAWCDFYPRSIGERAEDLGGTVRVERRDGGHTAVVIEVPI